MNVLVTGGAGYVGSVLTARLLQSGHRVRILDNLMYGGRSMLSLWSDPHFEFTRGDLRDDEAVRRALEGMDAVVHLAAIVGDPACAANPALAKAVNLDASLNLIAECRKSGISRFVFASTCSNYGKMEEAGGTVDETSELRPVSLYAEAKVAVEKVLLDPEHTKGMCATPLRISTVYGVSPRMRFDLTVNEFTREMLVTKKLVVFGQQFWRPYIHVRDMSRALALVLEAPENLVNNQVFNVGANDQNYQKQQLVELIRPHAPDVVIEIVHRDEDPRDYKVKFDKIISVLKFELTMRVPDGIREVAALVNSGALGDAELPEWRN